MEISEIRIKLMDDPNDRLQAFCSITFDGCFVIRDLKIIQGGKGSFVAMPSRKLMDRCPRCGSKNHLRAQFCNDCGCRLHGERAIKDDDGRAKLYADIAHPINQECRDQIQHRVLEAFAIELERSRQPGYVCTYDDYGEERFARMGEDEDGLELPRILSVDQPFLKREPHLRPESFVRIEGGSRDPVTRDQSSRDSTSRVDPGSDAAVPPPVVLRPTGTSSPAGGSSLGGQAVGHGGLAINGHAASTGNGHAAGMIGAATLSTASATRTSEARVTYINRLDRLDESPFGDGII